MGSSSGSGNGGGGNSVRNKDDVVMHVHFGMSGAFKLFEVGMASAPAATPTTRLRLEQIASTSKSDSALGAHLGAHLSAMTVDHGTLDLYRTKTAALGQDPLRGDADPEILWLKINRSKKSIGVSYD